MFVFCIESSHARGLGHLYRSLRLASLLRERGLPVRFLVNDHPFSIKKIAAEGHSVEVVDLAGEEWWEADQLRRHAGSRVWINDRLDTGLRHMQRLKSAGIGIATFDDRGEGAALADLHIAALAFDDAEPLGGGKVLRGMNYLLLDPFLAKLRRRRERLGSLLLTMGGSDTWGVTPRVMQALLDRGRPATIVLGPAFAHAKAVDSVRARAPQGLFTVHRHGVPSLAAEMARHDLAITGGGMTPFEANAIGLPCIVIANERFEIPVCRALGQSGGCVFAGFHSELDLSWLDRDLPLAAMSEAGMAVIDMRGCERVADALMQLAEVAQ